MNSIVKLFANPCLVEILGIFLGNPESEFYQTEIVKRTSYALIQVQRVLKTLQTIGLISSIQQGRMVYYQVVRSHFAFEDLKHLFFKSFTLESNIRQSLLFLNKDIQLAFIFGSVAKGNEGHDSDIDLFLLSSLTLREISKILTPLSQKLRREVNPVIFSGREFKNRILQKDHFVLELLGTQKLWMIGNEDDLNRVVIP